jgi:general secretion pathway protein K
MRAAWHRQRGAALVVVLAFAAVIASLAATASRTILGGAAAVAVFADAMRADELGRAAADLVLDRVASGGPEARRGGAFTARLSMSELEIDYVSEAARVDINTAPPRMLGALFRVAGAEPVVAADIADRIEKWRRSGGTPSSNEPPGNRRREAAEAPALERIEQIMQAWGISATLFTAIHAALTVANRSSKVDPTLAPRLVVAALMNGSVERTEDFLERRQRGFLNADEALAQLPEDTRVFSGFVPARAFHAIARVIIAGRFRRSYEFVVAPAARGEHAANILSWQPLLR